MRVLVTGSSGFIGQHLARSLADRGDEVLGLDIRPATPVGWTAATCDILDGERVREVFSSFAPSVVIHLAARTDLDGSTLHDYAANVDGVQNVVRAVASIRSVQRVIYTSTQLVCRVGHVPAGDEEYAPDNLYGESKVAGEKIVRAADGGGVVWCIVRPTTIWGPGMSAHYQRFLNMIRRGRYVHVGSKPLLKSYGYVGNTVFEYLRLLEAPTEQIHRKTFYLADYEPLDLRRWAEELRVAFSAPPIRSVPRPIARTLAVAGDILNTIGFKRFPFNSFRLRNVLTEYQFDMSPLAAVCGSLPYTFADGIRQTAEWFVKRDQSGT